MLTFGHIMDSSFSKHLDILQKNLETNDISFESHKIELLESRKKLGVASLWEWPCPLNWKSTTFISRTLFSDFELWRLTISRPVEVGKSYILQKKALLPIVWKKFWNWKNLCNGRLQKNFSKGSAFSVKRAWPPLGWCHAQFLYWF